MKLVTNGFEDISAKAGIGGAVANAACLFDDRLYIGTDGGGMYVIGDDTLTHLGLTGEACRIEGITGSDDAEDRLVMERRPDLPGWDAWKKKNKAGVERSVRLVRRGRRIVVTTDIRVHR